MVKCLVLLAALVAVSAPAFAGFEPPCAVDAIKCGDRSDRGHDGGDKGDGR